MALGTLIGFSGTRIVSAWLLSIGLIAISGASYSIAADSKANTNADVLAVVENAADESHSNAHEAAGHHDPTHDHAGPMQGNPMEFRSDGALFSLVVFGLLLAVLYAVAWKPIAEGLAKRETTIANQIAEAKKAAEDGAAKLKEYEAKLATATTQAQDLLNQARKDSEAAGQRILLAAQEEAARQRDRALTDIESAKQAALSDLAAKSTDLAFSLARRVVGRELNGTDHQYLINEALNNLPNRN